MRALVVYDLKRGGTEGFADMVGQAPTEHGIEVTVRSAAQRVPDVGNYDVDVVGGAQAQVLRGTEVWLFSSGPLGDDVPPAIETEPIARARVRWTASGRSLT